MVIERLSLTNNIFLAPMAGITNLPFRELMREFGCAFAFTEMISAEGLVRGSEKTAQYLASSPSDSPLGVQIFGSEPAVMAEGARIAADCGADTIDINMGCPAKKIVKAGAGAALLKEPLRIARIVRAVRVAVSLPVTVKLRSGWSSRSLNAVEIAAIAEDCGADGVIVHPRTGEQGFSGEADWNVITAVKKGVTIPVIGNGDVSRPDDALRLLSTTGCDGIMIGRGVLGNPWLLAEIAALLSDGRRLDSPSLAEKERVIGKHLEKEIAFYGDLRGSRHFRKHLLWYTKHLPGSAKLRRTLGSLEDKETMLQELHEFLCRLSPASPAGP